MSDLQQERYGEFVVGLRKRPKKPVDWTKMDLLEFANRRLSRLASSLTREEPPAVFHEAGALLFALNAFAFLHGVSLEECAEQFFLSLAEDPDQFSPPDRGDRAQGGEAITSEGGGPPPPGGERGGGGRGSKSLMDDDGKDKTGK